MLRILVSSFRRRRPQYFTSFLCAFLFFLFSLTASAHVYEIRVNQEQDGSLTWYLQSYHFVNECGHVGAGLTINGVNYPIQAEYAGSDVALSPTVFAYNSGYATSGRNSYAVVHTPYIGGTLNVSPYSTNACWAFAVSGSGSFTPPPPPTCTSCPLTGWTNTLAASGNNNGTVCDRTDDQTTATIKVAHLACANITGDKQFRVIFDPAGAGVVYGPFNYASGIETQVTINIPYGTSTSTQVQVIDDDYPCQITHGLSIPSTTYTGEKETVPPSVETKSDMTVSTATTSCDAVVTYDLPTYSDNCGTASIQQIAGLPSGSVFPKGTTTNTFKVTDAAGNEATSSFNVTVTDQVAPVAKCKAISVPLGADKTASITAADVNNGSFDVCGSVTLDLSGQTTFDCEDIGKTVDVTLTVTDEAGLTSSCVAKVTITDPNLYCNVPPVAVCKALTVNANNSCQGVASASDFDGGSTDANGDQLTFSVSPAGPYAYGTTNVVLTVTDTKGASSTCSTTITVVDNTRPTITAPADVAQASDAGQCGAAKASVNLGNATTWDNCGVASVTNDAPAVFPVGNTTVNWTVTDIHGLQATAQQVVSITDGEAPSITTNGNKSVGNDAGKCGAAVTVSASAADNCSVGNPVGTRDDGKALTDDYPVGTTTITWNVSDIHGNPASATQTVTVSNTTPVVTSVSAPVDPIPVNTPITLSVAQNDNNATSADITWGDGSAVQNVSNSASSFTTPHTYTGAGVYTVKVKATDACQIASADYTYQYVVVYDPSAGFVTGGGTILSPVGAYAADPTLSGKATFGFVSRYQKGATVPSGNTDFQFHAAGMNFKSSVYEWLVISGSKAQYKGRGTINGSGDYGFLLSAVDGNLNSTPSADLFRIKIWDRATSAVVYDNQVGAADDATPTTSISSGSIVVQAAKSTTKAEANTQGSGLADVQLVTERLNVTAMPNPSAHQFTLKLQGAVDKSMELRVLDVLGRVVEVKRNLAANSSLTLGNSYRPGVYIVELRQGAERTTVKLIKSSN